MNRLQICTVLDCAEIHFGNQHNYAVTRCPCVSLLGYYMIFNSRIGQIGDRMQLISPLMEISQSTQLQFSYYISHSQPHGGSLLQLFQVSKLGIRVKLLFESSMSGDTTWHLATICLQLGSYSLVFQGTMGNPLVSDIAIDSIRVTMNNQCLVVSGPATNSKDGKREIGQCSSTIV